MKARSVTRAGVRDLIVVLDETDESLRRNAKRRSAAQNISPRMRLPLIQKTVFRSGNKFLRIPGVVAEIPDVVPSQRADGAVMKIVIPHRIQTVAGFIPSPRHL